MSVPSNARITSIPSRAFLSCLQPTNYTEGSRVPPPMRVPRGLRPILSGGGIAGVVVGSVCVALILAVVVVYLLRRRRRNATKNAKDINEMSGEDAETAREMSVDRQRFEASAGDAAVELNPDAQRRGELSGNMVHELEADTGAVEVDGVADTKEEEKWDDLGEGWEQRQHSH